MADEADSRRSTVLLDFGHPGSGLALRLLDEISGELVDQQVRLVQLAALAAAAATGYFLEMPDRATMVTLRQVYAPQLTPMHEFQLQAAEWAPALVTIRGNLSSLDQALAALGRDPNPIYQIVTAPLIPAISPLHDYVAGLSDTISEQAERLPGDIAAMRAVVTADDQALAWEALLAAAAPGVGNTLARANFLLFLGLFTVLAGASTGQRRVR